MPKNKKQESSSDSSSDDSSSEVQQKKVAPKKEEKKASPAPKKEEPKKKKVESSSDSDSDSESDAKAKKAAPKKEEPKKKAAKKESSSEDSSDASSSEEAPKKKDGNDKKRKAEAPQEDAPPAKKAKTEDGAAPSAPSGDGTRCFLGNLSFKIDDDAIRAFFKDVGELSDIHWVTDKQTGKFYGTGFVAFATAEEAKAAVAKSGQEVLGRPIRIDFAQAKGDRTSSPQKFGDKGAGAGKFGDKKDARGPTPKPDGCTTVFLGNLSFSVDEAAVRSHFADCGEISSIRWVERDGQFKGCGFVEFSESGATDKAVAKNGSDLMGRAVRVDFSAPKPPRQF